MEQVKFSKLLWEDDRDITHLTVYYNDSNIFQYVVGANNISKIQTIKQTGDSAYVAWFGIFYGEEEEPKQLINGKFVIDIHYRNN